MTDTITPPVPGRTGAANARRPSNHVSRRQAMLWAAGVLCVIVGSTGALALVRAGDQRDRVLIVTRDLPAGAQIGSADIGVAEVASDDLNLIADTRRAAVIGSYTKVRILAGQPVALGLLQNGPLVTPGQVVIAVPVTPVQLPAGLREQSLIELVVPAPSNAAGAAPVGPFTARGVVVQFPAFADGGGDVAALSVEVAAGDAAALVAAGREISVILIDPTAGGG